MIDYLLIYIGKNSQGEVVYCAWIKNILLTFKNQLTSVQALHVLKFLALKHFHS